MKVSNLEVVSGTDKQGILGFLLNDIQTSVQKYRDRECYLCGKMSAAVSLTLILELLQYK